MVINGASSSVCAPGGSVAVIGNIIRENYSGFYYGGFIINASASSSGQNSSLVLADNVIVDNVSQEQTAGGVLCASSMRLDIYNNTVAYNATRLSGSAQIFGGLGIIQQGQSTTVHIFNNIIWQNHNIGLYIESASAQIFDNDIGEIYSMSPQHLMGNVSIAPQFVDEAAGDFHLQTSSPVINFSAYHFNEVDPDGNPDPTSGLEDLGAYHVH